MEENNITKEPIKGRFVPGKSGNASGKPKGALNKKTKEQISRAQRMMELIEDDENFEDEVKNMPIKEKMILYKDLLEYLEPKLSRVEHTGGNGEPFTISVVHKVAQMIPPPEPVYELTNETPTKIETPVIISNPDNKKPF